jgi:transposase-like protein
MAQKKISFIELEQLVREGNGVSEIARKMGVTKGAVSKALKKLNVAISKDVALRSAPQVVERKINAIEQLQKINEYANELLDLLMRWNRGDEEALQILESQIATKKVRIGKKEEFVREYKFTDPRQLALRAMAEIRGQLEVQMELFKTLYNAEEVAAFQKIVLNEIGHESPETKSRILQRLNERRAARSTLSLS